MGSFVRSIIMHIRATSSIKLWSYPIDPQRKEKKIKLFTRESSQQVKEEREIFLAFHFNYTTSMEIKLTNLFLVFLNVYQTHKKKTRKINLSMDDTIKKCEHRQMKISGHECNVGENTYSPKLRLLAKLV